MISSGLFDAAPYFREISESVDDVSVLSEEKIHGLSYFLDTIFSETRLSDNIM